MAPRPWRRSGSSARCCASAAGRAPRFAAVACVPGFPVRLAAFRLGLLDLFYAEDFEALLRVSQVLSRFFDADTGWGAPLARMASLFGCRLPCPETAHCPARLSGEAESLERAGSSGGGQNGARGSLPAYGCASRLRRPTTSTTTVHDHDWRGLLLAGHAQVVDLPRQDGRGVAPRELEGQAHGGEAGELGHVVERERSRAADRRPSSAWLQGSGNQSTPSFVEASKVRVHRRDGRRAAVVREGRAEAQGERRDVLGRERRGDEPIV